MWLIAIGIGTAYTFYWDMREIWGLGDASKMCQKSLVYKDPLVYYIALAFNLILRYLIFIIYQFSAIGLFSCVFE